MINPGTRGKIVLELSNTAPRPVVVRGGNNGVAKFMFFKSSNCSNPYDGAYQDQNDIRLPRSRM
jgi:deoxycytidine triphosphate deaminase